VELPVSNPLAFALTLSEHRSLLVGFCSAPQATEKNLNIYGQEAKASMWVTIRVTDVNDHKPEFYNCSLPGCSFSPQEAQVNFIGYVDEHASARISIDGLTMVAYDPDQAGAGERGGTLMSEDWGRGRSQMWEGSSKGGGKVGKETDSG
jgi:hypothetical protein